MGSPSEPICRICGSTDGENSIDIFGPEGERHHLEQKLNFCFTKEVSSNVYLVLLNRSTQLRNLEIKSSLIKIYIIHAYSEVKMFSFLKKKW